MLECLRPHWSVAESDDSLSSEEPQTKYMKTEEQSESEDEQTPSRTLPVDIIQSFDHWYPCNNQFNWSFNTRKSCTSICICLVETLSRTQNLRNINWKDEVFFVAHQLHNSWENRSDYKKVEKFPMVEELFEIIHRSSEDKFILGKCEHGIFRERKSDKINHEVASDIEDIFERNLIKKFDFLLITVRDITFLVGKHQKDQFFLFDSHGHSKFPPTDQSVIVTTNDIQQLSSLVITLYYDSFSKDKVKKNEDRNREDIMRNTFNAIYVKKSI